MAEKKTAKRGGAADAATLTRDSSTANTNLTVLRRGDPSVQEVLGTAGHVCLYAFDVESKEWSRKDVEGSMFVVRRSVEPQYQFILLNRLSTGAPVTEAGSAPARPLRRLRLMLRRAAENLVQDLTSEFEFELSKPYLLYRTENEVNGLWFYEDGDGQKMTDLFTSLLATLAKQKAAPPAAAAPAAAAAPPAHPSKPHADAVMARLQAVTLQPAAAPAERASAPPPPAAKAARAELLTPEHFAAPPPPPPPPPPPQPQQAAPAPSPPPATPPPPAAASISRSDVKDALLRLVVNDAFIELIHAELTKARR